MDAPPEDEPEEEESGDFTLFNVSFPSSHMISNFSVISHSATLTTLKPSQSMLSISTYPNFNFPIAGVDRRHNLIERRTKCGRSDKLLFWRLGKTLERSSQLEGFWHCCILKTSHRDNMKVFPRDMSLLGHFYSCWRFSWLLTATVHRIVDPVDLCEDQFVPKFDGDTRWGTLFSTCACWRLR